MSLILVDDRNLRVADFTQFWATAKVYPHFLLYYLVEFGCCFRILWKTHNDLWSQL